MDIDNILIKSGFINVKVDWKNCYLQVSPTPEFDLNNQQSVAQFFRLFTFIHNSTINKNRR